MIGLDGEAINAGTPTAPAACPCPRAILARALDAVTAMSPADLETVLGLAEARRVGVRAALAAAFQAEAAHLAARSRQAYAAANRLAVPATLQA